MLFSVVPKNEIYNGTIQEVGRLQGCGTKKTHVRLFAVVFSSEVPSRLSTNTLLLGKPDRSEGM